MKHIHRDIYHVIMLLSVVNTKERIYLYIGLVKPIARGLYIDHVYFLF